MSNESIAGLLLQAVQLVQRDTTSTARTERDRTEGEMRNLFRFGKKRNAAVDKQPAEGKSKQILLHLL